MDTAYLCHREQHSVVSIGADNVQAHWPHCFRLPDLSNSRAAAQPTAAYLPRLAFVAQTNRGEIQNQKMQWDTRAQVLV